MVGATRFELATPCTPCKCATRLRHAPTEGPNDSPKGLRELGLRRPLAAKNFDQFFQFEPHLMNQLLALIEIHLRIVAGETVSRSADRKPLFIQQTANLTNDTHILSLIVAAAFTALLPSVAWGFALSIN